MLPQIGYVRHWRGTLYLRGAAVHRRCQLPPKGLGTNKTVEAKASLWAGLA